MDYIKAGRGVVLTRWFHFAAYHKMVVTVFRANVPTVDKFASGNQQKS